MTLKEFYNSIDGDYNDVIERLLSEKLIYKFIVKFVSDNTFESLSNAVIENSLEDIERYTHTLKGIARNFGFSKLYKSSNELMISVREGRKQEIPILFTNLKDDYNNTISAINKLIDTN